MISGQREWKGEAWVQIAARHPSQLWLVGLAGVAIIAGVDYLSGAEVRVFPLYYAPISLMAWHQGRAGALILAALSAALWVTANVFAGLQFSHPLIWVANAAMQGASFAIVGLLIASLREAVVRERGLSRTDPLTSLLNSRAFYEEASALLALCRRKRWPVTLAYLDLDDFKAVNDGHGHQAGDAVLRAAAKLIRESVRPSDLLARLGGDEFAVLLPEVDLRQAAVTLERLRSLIGTTRNAAGVEVTASIGAVTFAAAPENVEEMVRLADARMYVAKNAGRDRVHLESATAERTDNPIAALDRTVDRAVTVSER